VPFRPRSRFRADCGVNANGDKRVLSSVVLIVVAATSIWVFVDARQLGAKRGVLGGGFLDSSAGAWFIGCLLLWIIAFPCYLAARPKLVAARSQRQVARFNAAHPVPSSYTARAGWQQPPNAATPRTPAQSSVLDELERLAHLHRSGALTSSEYTAMKQRLI
jgi:hypothetical protein